jgi:acyl CoA:acetate/3-ketoacid CoA transferase beta subunit
VSARDDVCVVALAEAFRGDGEILASPMGPVPQLAAGLAKAFIEPGLMVTDGVASVMEGDAVAGWLPYRAVFDLVWSGRRHVIMGASQIDRFGNQNISCVGDWRRPTAMLLGVRGAPGNTINHATSYWVPKHSRRVFVERVDVVSGVGYDRAAELGSAARFHDIRRVVSDLGVFDFATPDRRMRLRSLHPGVSLDELRDQTGFELAIPGELLVSREPTARERAWLEEARA